ncbi:hypothetical protein NE865_13347 [Phthorimaea operculella]|nr:hypothetical protein NE865_13347 [Phthorimaea operculella]
MEFKGLFVLFVVGVAICSVQAFPRDSSVVKTEDEIRPDESVVDTAKDKVEVQTTVESEVKTTSESLEKVHVTTDKNEVLRPRQVSCKHEEATDDLICQEHCLPKGYSFGLCVNYKCSCV